MRSTGQWPVERDASCVLRIALMGRDCHGLRSRPRNDASERKGKDMKTGKRTSNIQHRTSNAEVDPRLRGDDKGKQEGKTMKVQRKRTSNIQRSTLNIECGSRFAGYFSRSLRYVPTSRDSGRDDPAAKPRVISEW